MKNDRIANVLRHIADRLDHLQSDRYHELLEEGKHRVKGHLIILGEESHTKTLTRPDRDEPITVNIRRYRTLCSCGKESLFPVKYIDKNVIRDCGHIKADKTKAQDLSYPAKELRIFNRFKNYIGEEIGLLLVTGYHLDHMKDIVWESTCACGKRVEMDLHRVRKSRDNKARYRNKIMSCESQICTSMVKNNFNRAQALAVLTSIMAKNAYR
jgi:hypothetical protein